MHEAIECAVVGGGPAGLIAAERLAGCGRAVTVFDRMPSVGRKFLLAGRGGLNITHSEPLDRFLPRYGLAAAALAPALASLGPDALRSWCADLGQPTFVGTSGRVFPEAFKATPLLRAWLGRLQSQGVRFRPAHRWTGWSPSGALRFHTGTGPVEVRAAATLLALGGASWPRLGSDGAWSPILREAGLPVSPLLPANCGVLVDWSEPFRARFAGEPLKRIAARVGDQAVRGEAVITRTGLEGGLIYALGRPIRDEIAERGAATLHLDLRPDLAPPELRRRMGGPGVSRANAWRRAGLLPAAAGLLRETGGDPKACVLQITGLAPIERAISTAGGLALPALDDNFMLRARPGVFAAGEMLDWDAPTGGYLLQACFSTGWHAANQLDRYLS
ncbi:MAG: TIGR03862 family flavoprotein [Acetobacteraceae bacterium]|nr:TIGR03862 family flavoprotein [Acetobacteraceae bacterium]